MSKFMAQMGLGAGEPDRAPKMDSDKSSITEKVTESPLDLARFKLVKNPFRSADYGVRDIQNNVTYIFVTLANARVAQRRLALSPGSIQYSGIQNTSHRLIDDEGNYLHPIDTPLLIIGLLFLLIGVTLSVIGQNVFNGLGKMAFAEIACFLFAPAMAFIGIAIMKSSLADAPKHRFMDVGSIKWWDLTGITVFGMLPLMMNYLSHRPQWVIFDTVIMAINLFGFCRRLRSARLV